MLYGYADQMIVMRKGETVEQEIPYRIIREQTKIFHPCSKAIKIIYSQS
jgi:ABC-type glutathione transport system ATPase component